jgi:hypothetical protein
MQRDTKDQWIVRFCVILSMAVFLTAIIVPLANHFNAAANDRVIIEHLSSFREKLIVYHATYQRYPPDDSWIETVFPAGGIYEIAPFVSENRKTGSKIAVRGFNFVYLSEGAQSFGITVVPQRSYRTGNRAFFMDETLTIQHCRCQFAGKCGFWEPSLKPIGAVANICA